MELHIENSQKVTSLFGYWPKFCDAKFRYFSFEVSERDEERIQIRLLYLDVDKSIGAEIEILFSGVSRIDINNLYDENVLDELVIVRNDADSNYNIELQACCGISGQFNCERIVVGKVIERDF